jgi:hypothetical protein
MGVFSDDLWTVGTADQDGQPIIIRVRSQMPDAAARQGHAQLIVVGWPYDGVATGLPGAEDNASMQAFEDTIEAGLEQSGVGVQVASLTGAGHKEWRYYAADADAFVAALNASLVGHPTYPLEIEMFDDADWQGLSSCSTASKRATRTTKATTRPRAGTTAARASETDKGPERLSPPRPLA